MALTGERFDLGARIGRGTSGDVHRAVDRLTGDTVAVKLVDLEDAEDEVEDIQREIATLAQIDSPFVTKYLGSWLDAGSTRLAIAMEYMAGGSVADLVRHKPLPEEACAVVLRDLLMALEYLHGTGKIHRDVKAANVLLSAEGSVRLADFGVAGQMTHTVGAGKRKTFTGTPFWMAPEVISQRPEGYDAKADIWSLGITAIEIATGSPPYADMHPMRVLFFIPKNPPPKLEGPTFSDEFKQFVQLCLQKESARRPRARDLSNAPFIVNAPENRDMLVLRIHERIRERDGEELNSRNESLNSTARRVSEREPYDAETKSPPSSSTESLVQDSQTRDSPRDSTLIPTPPKGSSAPSWDFGDGTIGRRFGKPPTPVTIPTSNPRQSELSPTETSPGNGKDCSPAGSSQTQTKPRMPSHPIRRGSSGVNGAGSVQTTQGSVQKSTTTTNTTAPPTASLTKIDPHQSAVLACVLSPALSQASRGGPNDGRADSAASRVAAAFAELESASPGACARFLNESIEMLSKVTSSGDGDSEIRNAAETGLRVFGSASDSANGTHEPDTKFASSENNSVLGDFLLARWQRDLK
tara:strand:+ start:175 stop:1920 length:1746 start_codon:yes stop_codon:yes gene_type:complete